MKPINPAMRRLFAIFGCLALVGSIFIGGEQPAAGHLFPPLWDKAAHLAAYGAMGVLAALAFPAQSLLTILLVVGGIGGADEIHQMFIPGRQAGLGDLLADLGGGLIILPAITRLRCFYYRASDS